MGQRPSKYFDNVGLWREGLDLMRLTVLCWDARHRDSGYSLSRRDGFLDRASGDVRLRWQKQSGEVRFTMSKDQGAERKSWGSCL